MDSNLWDRNSELDRQLQADISDVSDSSLGDLFGGDDTDLDPTYDPESDVEPPPTRPRLDLPSSSSQSRPRLRTTQQGRRLQDRLVGTRPNPNRHVFSSSSDLSSDEDETDNEIWEGINEVDPEQILHAFDFQELPGSKHVPENLTKPVDFFNLFFTEVLLRLFVTETNRYANQTITAKRDASSPNSFLRKWVPVTLLEIKMFIATVMNMGLIRKPSIKSYWSTSRSQSTPWFGQVFTRARFEQLLSFFHIVNNETLPKVGDPNYDPTQKFKPLMDHCNNIFLHFYTAHQQLSVDESLIGTKCQTQLMQYLPNKHHHRWGVKLWVLCDSVSNYCLNFICYKGKKGSNNQKEVKNEGLGFTVVKSLLAACNYLQKGYHIFSDNFFTSVNLVKYLYENKTFYTGTVRKTRKDLPGDIKNQLEVGQKKYWKKQNVIALSYREKKTQKKPVLLLTSKTVIQDTENMKRRHGREVVENKPATIIEYNKYMGGIDSNDMMLYSYLDERRTVKYWKKVAFNLFARMVLNSYIIYKEVQIKNARKPLSRYKYCVSFIDDISEEWFVHKQFGGGGDGGNPGTGRKIGLEKLDGKKEKTCWVCSKKGENQKGRKRSRTVCVQCKEGCHAECLIKHICRAQN